MVQMFPYGYIVTFQNASHFLHVRTSVDWVCISKQSYLSPSKQVRVGGRHVQVQAPCHTRSHATETFYFEQQQQSFCQVHAVDMLLGHAAVTAGNLFDAYKELLCDGWDNTAAPFFHPIHGNFSDGVVKRYLGRNLNHSIRQLPGHLTRQESCIPLQ